MSLSITRLPIHTRPTAAQRVANAWRAVRTAYQVAATRRQLGTLDDRALADIGISRAQAQFVAEAPIWDVLR